MLVLPAVNGSVMLELPTFVESVVSRKSPALVPVTVSVNDSLVSGGTGIDTLPCSIMLLPIIGALTLIIGAAVTEIGTVIVLMPAELIVKLGLPTATPVTVICAVSWPAGIVTVAGTVAKLVWSIERLKVM